MSGEVLVFCEFPFGWVHLTTGDTIHLPSADMLLDLRTRDPMCESAMPLCVPLTLESVETSILLKHYDGNKTQYIDFKVYLTSFYIRELSVWVDGQG